jgi:alkylhydroperoxidase/carboxymuconolactone decarboxylase family protein YurZ
VKKGIFAGVSCSPDSYTLISFIQTVKLQGGEKKMEKRPSVLRALEAKDPGFFKLVTDVMKAATSEGALDTMTKTLISLALDAAGGHAEGVKGIAERARKMGISEMEIAETVRLAFLVGGFPGLVTGLNAFPE